MNGGEFVKGEWVSMIDSAKLKELDPEQERLGSDLRDLNNRLVIIEQYLASVQIAKPVSIPEPATKRDIIIRSAITTIVIIGLYQAALYFL